MAKKRMVSNQIVDSDAFLDMPLSTQALYFHLLVRADDEGFSNNVKKVMRMVKAGDDDLKVLIGKKFVIMFESGVLVIKHWLIHNTIRKDRLIETTHLDEKSQIEVKRNKSYTMKKATNKQITVDDVQTSGKCQSDDRIDKVSLDKTRLDKSSKDTMSSKHDSVPYKEIIQHLNEKTKSHYRFTTKKTKSLIKARFNEGFKLNDFKKVIDIKVDEWLEDDKMNKFLRPETLFGTKFESYLNQEYKKKGDHWLDEWEETL